MSFNDQRALEMLPARIAALQTEIAGLNAVVADPDLYARDPGRFGATTRALAVARNELAAAEERWLTLEMLRVRRRRRARRGLPVRGASQAAYRQTDSLAEG